MKRGLWHGVASISYHSPALRIACVLHGVERARRTLSHSLVTHSRLRTRPHVHQKVQTIMDGQDSTAVMCVECEDQEATVKCQNCVDYYCDPCYEDQHRKGQRAKHVQRPIHQVRLTLNRIKERQSVCVCVCVVCVCVESPCRCRCLCGRVRG